MWLPDTPATREDFEWLRAEVIAAGGQSSILAARALTAEEGQSIVRAFQSGLSSEIHAPWLGGSSGVSYKPSVTSQWPFPTVKCP